MLPELVARGGGVLDDDAMLEWQQMPSEHVARSTSKEIYDEWIVERFRDLLRRCGVDATLVDSVVEESERLRAAEAVELIEGAREVIASIKRTGLLVAVCSNWDWDLDRHLEHNDIAEAFDAIVCSAIVGYRKPHPAIFEVVSTALGVDSEDVVFVGDDDDADLLGAQNAGMVPVHAAWATPCRGLHGPTVSCCQTFDELLRHPALALGTEVRSDTRGVISSRPA
jgi:HAD superfamily hydrolase (TIGR01509 family)